MTATLSARLQGLTLSGRRGRVLKGGWALAAYAVGVLFALYEIYYLGFAVLDPWLFRAGHLMFALVFVFLLSPATARSPKDRFSAGDVTASLAAAGAYAYLWTHIQGMTMRAGVDPRPGGVLFGAVILLLTLEAARRFFGWALPVLAAVFVVYLLVGRYIPGLFGTPAFKLPLVLSYLAGTNGIYGQSLATSANFVYLFVLFGAFINRTGVGDVFTRAATSVTGRFRGGPAKACVMSSAFFGSISGSAQANVVTVGTLTIPLMRRTGYPDYFAAAIETASSLGGLFMPPIMGAGGFLMADILGIPYVDVAKAALIPAALYYLAVFLAVDAEAARRGMKGMARDEVPRLWNVIRRQGVLLLPVLVLVYLLVTGVPTVRAALWTTAAAVAVGLMFARGRMTVRGFIDTLAEGSRMALNAAIATACAGVIVGVMAMTGLGLTATSILVDVGTTSVLLSLAMAAAFCAFLGMDLPITATYITVAVLLAPALEKLGIAPLAANLFLYFMAATSGMTPPVAVTAYAAAAVSGANPLRIAFTAVRIGWTAYIVPFVFVFAPGLLLMGPAGGVMYHIAVAIVGLVAVTAAVHGYLMGRLPGWLRLVLAVAGASLFSGATTLAALGSGLLAAAVFWQWTRARRPAALEQGV